MTTLNANRRTAADAALENHDFGDVVVAARNGWEFTAPGVEYTCTLFFENPDSPQGDALKGHFVVMFDSKGSARVRDAYAMVDGNLLDQLAVYPPNP